MKEIGIQFSPSMVRALLDGTKTVTRRTVKGEIPAAAERATFEAMRAGGKPAWRWLGKMGMPLVGAFRCPYGVAGDRLWVREAWRVDARWDGMAPRDIPAGTRISYEADGPAARLSGKFRPGMFMPRWASRIVRENVGVTCERLQDITPEQSIAEGLLSVESCAFPGTRSWADYNMLHDPFEWFRSPVDSYRSLWITLNGPESWAENPFVFAISFGGLTS